jgi:hypothetical protein
MIILKDMVFNSKIEAIRQKVVDIALKSMSVANFLIKVSKQYRRKQRSLLKK